MIWSSDYKKINCKSDSLRIAVPVVIVSALRTIEEKIGNVEFSILSKIDKFENNVITIAPNYVIPKQIVTYSSVEYCEHIEGYNVVIHKHPMLLKSFSGIDDEFINSNFDLSLLYVDNKIETASFRIVDKDLMIFIETKNIEIVIPKLKQVKGIDKIEKKQIVSYFDDNNIRRWNTWKDFPF